MTDRSNGYEGVTVEFLARRGSGRSTGIGVNEVRTWARTLPLGAAVIVLRRTRGPHAGASASDLEYVVSPVFNRFRLAGGSLRFHVAYDADVSRSTGGCYQAAYSTMTLSGGLCWFTLRSSSWRRWRRALSPGNSSITLWALRRSSTRELPPSARISATCILSLSDRASLCGGCRRPWNRPIRFVTHMRQAHRPRPDSGGEIGHASLQTTERYLGTKQDLVHPPNDAIRLKVAVWRASPGAPVHRYPGLAASVCAGKTNRYSPHIVCVTTVNALNLGRIP
jgi:hypothetical protein